MAVAGAERVQAGATRARILRYLARTWPLYLMLVPGMIFVAIFSYYPMYGVVIAFQDFNPGLGFVRSPWVGLKHFRYILTMNPDFYNILRNTIVISTLKIATMQVSAIALALLLNEVKNALFKRTVQTIVYLPHFLSWIVLGGIILDMLGSNGIVTRGLKSLGLESPPMFLGSNKWFVPTLIVTNLWQGVGWSTIIYLAALTSVDPQLHEAAAIDGANRFQRVWHVTLPGISSTIVLLACLSLGNVLQAGFDQVFMLYNPAVYASGDILDTYVFRAGLIAAQYSMAGAIGLIKSAVGFVLIVIAYYLADKYAGYRIF
ncbi:MAG TPA: sugar ABC transporter permease [Chloroflexi bacterium]|jgi:putative aldouronate transport system permease protein|nr:sugar ABC transporter permease [Chloroflexota bacterium]